LLVSLVVNRFSFTERLYLASVQRHEMYLYTTFSDIPIIHLINSALRNLIHTLLHRTTVYSNKTSDKSIVSIGVDLAGILRGTRGER